MKLYVPRSSEAKSLKCSEGTSLRCSCGLWIWIATQINGKFIRVSLGGGGGGEKGVGSNSCAMGEWMIGDF